MIRVYPRVERLRRVVAPLATRPASGNRAARRPGDGIEFAETREFRAGDRVRRINWRASARRGRLLVADRLPERSSDVVCFLDSLAQAQTEEASTLDFSVRAAAALVSAYLPRRDRVGLLSFGAELQWVLPSGGARQQYRIVDAVLASESSRFYRWRDPRFIPRRVLPPQSLVVALTPLLDWRVIRALLDLRGRGFDLAVIEVDPVALAAEARSRYGDDAWRVGCWRVTRRARASGGRDAVRALGPRGAADRDRRGARMDGSSGRRVRNRAAAVAVASAAAAAALPLLAEGDARSAAGLLALAASFVVAQALVLTPGVLPVALALYGAECVVAVETAGASPWVVAPVGAALAAAFGIGRAAQPCPRGGECRARSASAGRASTGCHCRAGAHRRRGGDRRECAAGARRRERRARRRRGRGRGAPARRAASAAGPHCRRVPRLIVVKSANPVRQSDAARQPPAEPARLRSSR